MIHTAILFMDAHEVHLINLSNKHILFINAHEVHVMNLSKTAKGHRAAVANQDCIEHSSTPSHELICSIKKEIANDEMFR